MKRLGFLIYLFFISIMVSASEIDINNIQIEEYSDNLRIVNNTAIFEKNDEYITYKVVLENKLNYDVTIDELTLNNLNNNLFNYKIEGLNKDDVLEKNSFKEFYLTISSIEKSNSYIDDILNLNIKYRETIMDDTLIDVVMEKPNYNDKIYFNFICLIVIILIVIIGIVLLKKLRVNRNKSILVMFFLLFMLFMGSSNLYKVSYSNNILLESNVNINYKFNNIKILNDKEFCVNNECFDIIESSNNIIKAINKYDINDNSIQDESFVRDSYKEEDLVKYRNYLASYGINVDVKNEIIDNKEKVIISLDKKYLITEG